MRGLPSPPIFFQTLESRIFGDSDSDLDSVGSGFNSDSDTEQTTKNSTRSIYQEEEAGDEEEEDEEEDEASDKQDDTFHPSLLNGRHTSDHGLSQLPKIKKIKR